MVSLSAFSTTFWHFKSKPFGLSGPCFILESVSHKPRLASKLWRIFLPLPLRNERLVWSMWAMVATSVLTCYLGPLTSMPVWVLDHFFILQGQVKSITFLLWTTWFNSYLLFFNSLKVWKGPFLRSCLICAGWCQKMLEYAWPWTLQGGWKPRNLLKDLSQAVRRECCLEGVFPWLTAKHSTSEAYFFNFPVFIQGTAIERPLCGSWCFNWSNLPRTDLNLECRIIPCLWAC